MKILENKVIKKDDIVTTKCYKEISCNECGSILEITESDKHVGWLGAKFVTCPCCGEETMLDDEDGITLTVDNIQFPTHFYRTNKNLRQVKEVHNGEIEKCIREGIDYFRKNKDKFAWYTGTGDSRVAIYRYQGDEEYSVVVSKDFYETEIPFSEEDYD